MLVLDDLHHLTHSRSHEALQWLLDYAPPNLHVALVSRGAVPFSLGRLRDQGLVLELDMRDLRFTAAESEAFLRAQSGEISQREARQMHEMTDGWVAGLQLFAMRLKRRKSGSAESGPTASPTHAHLQDARAFADYFEREVLSRLSPPEVELLIRMATCTRACASLCVALTGDAQRLGEAASSRFLARFPHQRSALRSMRGREARACSPATGARPGAFPRHPPWVVPSRSQTLILDSKE